MSYSIKSFGDANELFGSLNVADVDRIEKEDDPFLGPSLVVYFEDGTATAWALDAVVWIRYEQTPDFSTV